MTFATDLVAWEGCVFRPYLTVFSVVLLILSAGCAGSFVAPRNSVDFEEQGYLAERIQMQPLDERDALKRGRSLNMARCDGLDLISAAQDESAIRNLIDPIAIPLSPGDVIRVTIPRGDGFAGDYAVEADGKLRMPHLRPIPAAGLTVEDVSHLLSVRLVSGEFFKAGFLRLDVKLLQHAAIQTHVSGAVFQSGAVLLNERGPNEISDANLDLPGDVAPGRTLSAALFAAGGIRPDADVRNVVLMRAGRRQVYDLSGAFTGAAYPDPVLVANDRIHVPSKGCFQEALARPSRVTMPGIRIFISNLTQPALNNASSSVGADSTRVPYGTKLLQGLVSGNCVGGVQATNARRFAVLISANPVTGESEVIARSIEDLVRRADRDDFNPVLLPGDAIACYDSHVTNLRDVLSVVSTVALPFTNALVLAETLK